MKNSSFFKKYDLRGTHAKDFEIKDIYQITQAIIYFFNQKKPGIKNIAVAMDGRIHSPRIKEQLCNAILDSGLNVVFIGLVPTPVLNFACHTINVEAGIMITASHNPKDDNGLKIVLGQDCVWAEQIETIKKFYEQKLNINAKLKGSYNEYDIVNDYTNFLVQNFPKLQNLNLNSVIDCGNGTAGAILPVLIKKLNWKNTKLLFEEIDGEFKNHEPDPTVEKNVQDIKNYLKLNKECQLGLGLDGDCDRLAAITKSGYLIPGDKLLAIFSQFLTKDKKNNLVVFDVKCSNILIEVLKKLNFTTIITPTGHAYIKDVIKKNNGLLGGELSGHFCFNDRYFGYDDGIYSMLRLYELLIISGKNLENLLEIFPQTFCSPEYRVECTIQNKTEIIYKAKEIFAAKKDIEILDIDGIRIHTHYGWGILRASNTEPILSLRFEGTSEANLLKIKNDFFNIVSPYFDKSYLIKTLEMD